MVMTDKLFGSMELRAEGADRGGDPKASPPMMSAEDIVIERFREIFPNPNDKAKRLLDTHLKNLRTRGLSNILADLEDAKHYTDQQKGRR